MTTLDMTTLDIVAMCIGYIVIAGFGIIILIVIVATIFGHHRELNNQIYEKELMKKGIDPHIDPKFMQ